MREGEEGTSQQSILKSSRKPTYLPFLLRDVQSEVRSSRAPVRTVPCQW
jgi:hypothetical protein